MYVITTAYEDYG